jgi:creatinine amidohydrolase/Fe(II)-dependent formamide hydrolase-like protein
MRRLLALATLVLPLAAAAAPVQLEALTSTELRARIAAGTTTVLLPIGGTEQNGPHMVLGKHNVRVRVLATRIAEQLGNAVVAPVLGYVPEGSIEPPAGHMRYAGTISIETATFEALLESAARSLRRHGFRDVVFLGDHGGYQASLQRVAARLNRAFAGGPDCRVHALPEYYRVVEKDYVEALKARGHAPAEIGSHAGLADTALTLAVDASLVRADALSAAAGAPGVAGDPRAATAELGRLGADRIVAASVAAIQAQTRR